MWLGRVTYDHLLPLHKRQCLVTIIFTNLPSLHPFSFHEMIFILVYFKTCPKQLILNLLLIINVHIFINRTYQCMYNHHLTENIQLCNCIQGRSQDFRNGGGGGGKKRRKRAQQGARKFSTRKPRPLLNFTCAR